jgi:hypothetical protein
MKLKLFSLLALVLIVLPIMAGSVLAANDATQVSIPNPLQVNTISDLISRIANYVFWVATAIFPLVIVYGAFQLLTTGGDVEKAIIGRKTITYAVIGYALIFISTGIPKIIADLLGSK